MKIAVCVKQVPSTTAVIRVAPEGLDLSGVELVLSPYDEYALEEGLKAKDANAGSTLTVITVGPDGAAKVLEHAFALGADEGIHVKADGIDARGAAACAAALLKAAPADLIFCGRQAIDDDSWLFPGTLGELLDLPHVTAAVTFTLSGAEAVCKRRIEGGEETLVVQLPAVVSADKGLNEPRSPTLKGRLAAKKKQAVVKTPADLGLDEAALAPALAVQSYAPPPAKSPGKMVGGNAAEAAKELVRLLREEAKVI